MKTSDFYYDLPTGTDCTGSAGGQKLFQTSSSFNGRTDAVEHRHFTDILDYLKEGDCLVINDTKVIPARLYGHKEETGALIEILLLKRKRK